MVDTIVQKISLSSSDLYINNLEQLDAILSVVIDGIAVYARTS